MSIDTNMLWIQLLYLSKNSCDFGNSFVSV